MGAQESRSQGNAGDDENNQEHNDYYSVLEISESASQDDIKKAFRKLALVHHPDKNADDIQGATKRFALIQQAYEVLSDEQERAWYDSHRASLVPEADTGVVLEEVRTGKHNVRAHDRGLTVRHLMKFFDASTWSSFDDTDSGFHALYRNLFSRLAQEEEQWGLDAPLPSFGHSVWSWSAAKGHEHEAAKTFYNHWLSFSTVKDFSWTERWNVSEAPDRRVRRLMEKENKKLRDDAKREYNDTVRSLVLFVRKRDPRYKLHVSRSAAATPSGSHPLESSTEARRRREQAGLAYIEQEWQRVKTEDPDTGAEWGEAKGNEEWECVACARTFRSEAAWESHERSRKHLKAVERLQQEMQHENDLLNLDGPEGTPSTPDSDAGPQDQVANALVEAAGEVTAQDDSPDCPLSSKAKKQRKAKTKGPPDEDQQTGTKAEISHVMPDAEPSLDTATNEGVEHQPIVPQLSKKDKRRARENAKKTRDDHNQRPRETCNVCREHFDSRTKLFAHINDTGHAFAGVPDDKRSDTSRAQKSRKGKR